MPLNYPAKSGGVDFEPVPAGSHIAVCDIVADLGLQPGSGMYPAPKNQVYIRFELPNERIDFEKDGKKQNGPKVIGMTYTASMNEKANLRHHLESWRGKQFTDEEAEKFDVGAVLGKPCMLTIMHKQKGDKTYANIAGIGPIPKGVDKKTIIPEMVPILYTPESSRDVYSRLPEWLRKKIDGQIIPEAPKQQTQGDQFQDDSFITDDDLPSEMFDDGSAPPIEDSSTPF